jgi:hypothetical protein
MSLTQYYTATTLDGFIADEIQRRLDVSDHGWRVAGRFEHTRRVARSGQRSSPAAWIFGGAYGMILAASRDALNGSPSKRRNPSFRARFAVRGGHRHGGSESRGGG